jgi:hypothetical protein
VETWIVESHHWLLFVFLFLFIYHLNLCMCFICNTLFSLFILSKTWWTRVSCRCAKPSSNKIGLITCWVATQNLVQTKLHELGHWEVAWCPYQAKLGEKGCRTITQCPLKIKLEELGIRRLPNTEFKQTRWKGASGGHLTPRVCLI